MDPRYGWDLHRADMAWALHAASRGLSNKIRDEILHPRDLSKKGGRERQSDCVRRSAIKAIRTIQPLSLNARLRYGRRGVTTSPQGAGMPAVPALARLTWCAVASLQASQPCGPLRCVTLAGCASGGSRLCATVEFGMRRLRLKKWRGVKESRHALAFGKRAQK